MRKNNAAVLHPPVRRKNAGSSEFAQGLCFFKLFWIFLIGCIIGCVIEMLWCYLVEGFWESRQGLIYGPFSPVYGFGAVIFTVVMYRFKHSNSLIIFFVSAIVGGVFEYLCSLFQEYVFGTISWEYSDSPLNLNGRTNLSYAVMWGVLGLLFMKHVLPFLEDKIGRIPVRAGTVITWILVGLMVLDILISSAAVRRQTDRHNGIPSTNIVTQFLDDYYPDSLLEAVYPNMQKAVS